MGQGGVKEGLDIGGRENPGGGETPRTKCGVYYHGFVKKLLNQTLNSNLAESLIL